MASSSPTGHVVDTEEGLSERYVHVHFADGTDDDATGSSHRPPTTRFSWCHATASVQQALGDPLRSSDAQTLYATPSGGGWRSASPNQVSAARRVRTTNGSHPDGCGDQRRQLRRASGDRTG